MNPFDNPEHFPLPMLREPRAEEPIDVKQVIYALERARDGLQAEADRLHEQLDYSAEFPAEDADRMREAIALLSAKPVEPAPPAPADIQAVIKAARDWSCDRVPNDFGEAELMKTLWTLDGDWPGCEGCDHSTCDEPCTPSTVAEAHANIDAHMERLVAAGKAPKCEPL